MSNDQGWHTVPSRSQKRSNKSHPVQQTPIVEQDISYSHQDWTPRIINGQSAPKPRQLDPPKKHISVNRSVQRLEQKAEDGDFHIERPTFELAQAIQSARNAKGWKQKDLALQCGLPLTVIQSYENRTASVDGQTLANISRHLGVKLSDKREKRQ